MFNAKKIAKHKVTYAKKPQTKDRTQDEKLFAKKLFGSKADGTGEDGRSPKFKLIHFSQPGFSNDCI